MAKRALVLLLTLFSLTVKDSKAAVIRQTTINRIDLPAEMSVAVSLNIKGYLFDIEGLTSPQAKVDFVSSEGNIEITTIADDQGRFFFHSVLAPIQTGDFCFLSYDIDGLVNNPLCFSPPPPNTKTAIAGIVLSPTVSLNKGVFRQNESVEARGRTFPNAQIQIFMFERERSWWREQIDVIIPAALARTGPKLELSSDQKGFFSFNLPTQKSSQWRFFVGPRIEDNFTPKSNVLVFSVLSWWQWFLLKLFVFLGKILNLFFKFLLQWEILTILLTVSITFVILKTRSSKG